MDYDREMELENAGIDAFEFSLMDEDERRETLEDAFLDPDDYDLTGRSITDGKRWLQLGMALQ